MRRDDLLSLRFLDRASSVPSSLVLLLEEDVPRKVVSPSGGGGSDGGTCALGVPGAFAGPLGVTGARRLASSIRLWSPDEELAPLDTTAPGAAGSPLSEDTCNDDAGVDVIGVIIG